MLRRYKMRGMNASNCKKGNGNGNSSFEFLLQTSKIKASKWLFDVKLLLSQYEGNLTKLWLEFISNN